MAIDQNVWRRAGRRRVQVLLGALTVLVIGVLFGPSALASQVGAVTVTASPSTAGSTATYTVSFSATSATADRIFANVLRSEGVDVRSL